MLVVVEPAQPNPGSLEAIRAELDLERAALDKRGDSVDTRAGLVLGFAGVMAGLALGAKSLFALPGVAVAAVAAIQAARVFWPRYQSKINPRACGLTTQLRKSCIPSW